MNDNNGHDPVWTSGECSQCDEYDDHLWNGICAHCLDRMKDEERNHGLLEDELRAREEGA